MLQNDEFLGTLQARETTDGTLTLKAKGGQYRAELSRGGAFAAERLNLSGAASALTDGSTVEFGGDRTKRVTVTQSGHTTYLYVEVGGRE